MKNQTKRALAYGIVFGVPGAVAFIALLGLMVMFHHNEGACSPGGCSGAYTYMDGVWAVLEGIGRLVRELGMALAIGVAFVLICAAVLIPSIRIQRLIKAKWPDKPKRRA